MEKTLFWQMEYAILSILKDKKRLSEEDYLLLSLRLREKISVNTHEKQ